MFTHDHIALCIIDVSTRWWVAVEIPIREEQTKFDAIDTAWVSHHGPPKEFVTESETAVYRSAFVQQHFQRKGISFMPHAKKQQIPHVDRRMTLQKIAIHKTISQLMEGGIVVPFKHILSDANFASTCLVTVNSMSPYMALYGRVPALLPDICQANADNEHLQVAPGTIRWTYRLRGIATAAMVNAPAQSRVDSALHAPTQPSGQTYNLKVGDHVEFHRDKASKDLSGWNGPAEVVDCSHPDRGHVTLRFRNYPFECRWQDVRPCLNYLVFVAHSHSALGDYTRAWSTLKFAVEKLNKHHYVTIGLRLQPDGRWHRSSETAQWTDILDLAIGFAAASYYGQTYSQLRTCTIYCRLHPCSNSLVASRSAEPHTEYIRRRVTITRQRPDSASGAFKERIGLEFVLFSF